MKTNLPLSTSSFVKSLRSACLLLFTLCLMFIGASSQAQVYYLTSNNNASSTVDEDALNRMNYDGSGVTTMVKQFASSPTAIAQDLSNNRLFIYEALNTTKSIKVVNASTGAITASITVPYNVSSMRYDAATGYIYFTTTSLSVTQEVSDALYKVRPTESTPTLIASSITTSPLFLALDIPNNRVFIYESVTANRGIKTFDLNSKTITQSATISGGTVADIAYDAPTGYIYYLTNDGAATVTSANDALRKILPGGADNSSIVIKDNLSTSPAQGMFLDAGNHRAYFYEALTANRAIKTVNLTTGDVATLVSLSSAPSGVLVSAIVAANRTLVNSATPSNVSSSNATLGGSVIQSDAAITERGVVYSSTNSTPTIGGNGVTKATNGTGTGSFSATISNLSPATQYYIRSYATSVAGTAYGEVKTFTTLSNDATLSSLTISAGTLSPAFSAGTTTYTASVSNATTSLTVTPSATNNGATVQINGSSPQPVNLNVGTNTITVLVTAADNVATKTYTLSITRAQTPQTITMAAAETKPYGTADYALSATASSGLQPAYTSSNTAVATIVGNNVHVVGVGTTTITASQAGNATYLAAPAVTQTLIVTKGAITVKAAAKTKVYGNADPDLTYAITSGSLATGDAFTGSLTREGASNASLAQSSAAGDYNITQGTLALDEAKYILTYESSKLVITKRPLAIAPVSATKIYGNPEPPSYPYQFINGTSVATSDGMSGPFVRQSGENAGTYALLIGQKHPVKINTGEDMSSSYDITFISNNLTITPKPLTVTPQAGQTKFINAADPTLAYTTSDLIGTDAATGNLSRSAGENVGTYAITIGSLSFGNNYQVTLGSENFRILPEPITVTANAGQSKVYGNNDPTFTYTITGNFKAGDVLQGALSRVAGANVGTYAITQGTLSGGDKYTVTFVGANFAVTKRPIDVKTSPVTKIYGDADPQNVPVTLANGTSLVTGDAVKLAVTKPETSNIPGTWPWIDNGTTIVNAATQADVSANYNINFIGGDIWIRKRPITMSPASKTKVYGSSEVFLNQFSVTSGSLAPGHGTGGAFARVAGENAGFYAISMLGSKFIVNLATSAFVTDYYNITIVPASYTITPKPVMVTANAQTKSYGDADPELTYTTDGALIENDTFTGGLTRATGEALGNYAINKGTLTAGANYAINYTASNLTIGKKTINVTANAATKVYGSADPAFTYTADSLRTGDTFSGALSRATGESVGTYALNRGTLGLSSNYVLNFTGADLSITKKTVAVAANAVAKTYGDTDPALTYTATGLINGETLTGALSRAAGENTGTYAISQGTLATNANYDLTYNGADFTINKATLSYVASPATKFYTQANPVLTGTVTGFVNGDSKASATTGTLEFSSTATNSSEVGLYPVTGTGLTAANYDFAQASGNATALAVKLSTNADLVSLSLPGATLSPAFNAATTYYTASVAEDVVLMNLDVTADPLARSVALNGAIVFSGQARIQLAPGNNLFSIRVFAQDYTEKIYQINIYRALSSNNLLKALSLNGVTISPLFNTNTLAYTASVPNSKTSVNVYGTAADPDAKVNVNGIEVSAANPHPVLLNVGENTIAVNGVAANGSIRTYTVVVTRAPSSDATLASLGNSSLTYTAAFNPATENYAGRTEYSYTESTTFLPVATNNRSTITVNGQALNAYAGNFVRLNFGNNMVTIVVTAEDGTTTKTYTVNAIRPRSSVATLTNLSIPFGGTINEQFNASVYNYTGNVPDSTYTGLRLNIARTDITATVKVNGVSVEDPAQYQMALHGGANKFKIEVTSQDTTSSKTYQLVVTRSGQAPPAQSANANLLAINVSSPGEGGGGFSYNVNFSYQQLEPVKVANSISSLYLYAYAEDSKATITANGQTVSPDNGYGPISLIVGENIINVIVTADDGEATRSYVMHITRLPYVNVDLANLTVNKGTLSPVFAAGITSYRVTVPANTTDIGVRPIVSATGATVTVDNAAAVSGKTSVVAIPYFPYNIRTVITSADGVTKKTYRLTVNRELSKNVTLNTFKLNPSSSIKAISATPELAVYSYSVPTDVTKVNFSAVAPEFTTWFTINGEYATSGVMSADIPLTGQSTDITLVAHAEDGVTTRTYQITVNKTGSSNANLTKLIPGTGTLSPVFAANTVAYEVPVSYSTTSITLKPMVAQSGATVKVNGLDVSSGSASAPVALVVGDNAISTEVTAASGYKKVYVVTVKRARSNNVVLKSFKLNPASSLVKGTNTAALASFTMSVSAATTKVNFSAILDDADASFTVNGLPATSGVLSSDIILAGYSTSIDAVVTAADGVTTKTYHIDVVKAGSINANLSKLSLSAGTLDPKFAANTTAYTATVSNLTSSITVTPTVGESSATVKVNGDAVISGTASAPVALNIGSNAIAIVVTSGNGNTKTYTVDVAREAIYQVQSTGDRNKPTALARDEKPAAPVETVAVTVHQAISPNGDGVNDKLTIDGILSYPENNVKVMNRNGQVIFEAKGYDNYTKAFDGHGNDGKLQQAGTYFYSLEYKDGQQVKRQTGYLVIKY